MQKYIIYFNTLKYMKTKQISYRLWYMLRKHYRKATKFSYDYTVTSNPIHLKFDKSIDSYHSLDTDQRFNFLNLSLIFENEIDWNTLYHGKLWAYNLNYFDFLNQSKMSKERGIALIIDYIDKIDLSTEGLEPFPIALRGINWVKFLNINNVQNSKIDDSLYAQYKILFDNLEYHLLGNHLLENGFSLLFGAYYFNDQQFYEKAKEILVSELDEQILKDGAHFELTPMYHQIMLFRVLDCLNLVSNNMLFDKELETLLRDKAGEMLSWLKEITYNNGGIPHFNDSANEIAPISNDLFHYADRLNVQEKKLRLSDSGYRAYSGENYELRVDVGEIGSSYIPGHAHSDTLNFELRVADKPFIVDTGISTYESNAQRLLERQTSSHNTVKIGNIEQSEVWSSFRVANRANIIFLKEEENAITASHDGYKKLGIMHQRTFSTTSESIQIRDVLIGKYKSINTPVSYIHFHPNIKDIRIEKDKIITKDVILVIKGSKNLELDDFTFANGFNKLAHAKVLKITFESELLVEISFI